MKWVKYSKKLVILRQRKISRQRRGDLPQPGKSGLMNMSRSFQRLAELYGYGNDTVNAKRVLHQHVPSLEEEAMIDHYMNAKQWSQARELMINADRVDNKNLMLLRQICSENTPECQEHITFTLKN